MVRCAVWQVVLEDNTSNVLLLILWHKLRIYDRFFWINKELTLDSTHRPFHLFHEIQTGWSDGECTSPLDVYSFLPLGFIWSFILWRFLWYLQLHYTAVIPHQIPSSVNHHYSTGFPVDTNIVHGPSSKRQLLQTTISLPGILNSTLSQSNSSLKSHYMCFDNLPWRLQDAYHILLPLA